MLSHLEYLYSVNVDLDARVKNLTADADTIAVYAHELGFVSVEQDIVIPIINCEFAEPIVIYADTWTYYSIEGKRPCLLPYTGGFGIEINLNV